MAVQTNVTKETAAVFVNVSGGDFLLYKLTPRGAQPVFTLVDSRVDKLLLSNQSTPISNNPEVFERRWPQPIDSVSTATNHTMGLHFIAATQYRYEVGLFDSSGQLKRSLVDITYSSTVPDDVFFQGLGVTAA
jgi:hypothetical protein